MSCCRRRSRLQRVDVDLFVCGTTVQFAINTRASNRAFAVLRIADILARPGSDWKAFEAPLSADEIADGLKLVGLALPPGLVELYHHCNGGEGSLPFQPWNFSLWGFEDVIQVRENEHYREYYSSLLFFGTNGGGEYFGLDPSGRVFFMDPIAGEESIIIVAESFDQFVQSIGVLPPDELA